MALTSVRKTELAEMDLPSDQDMRTWILSFLRRSGLNQAEFAEEIGYAPSSFRLFVSGRYDEHHARAENTLAIRAAAKQYMDLHEAEEAFHLLGTHYRTEDFLAVRDAAMNALDRGTAYILDGPPGTQKTQSLRRVEHEINQGGEGRAVYVYARVKHSPQSLLIECCTAAGVPHRGNIDSLLRKLRFFLASKPTLFMLDEAQHLDRTGLEIVRQLLDLPRFGVILAGSHDLTQRLSHWEMGQWRDRARRTLYLNGPSRRDCHDILRAELGKYPGLDLSDEACDRKIADCQRQAQRVDFSKEKPTAQTFHYTSARVLFGAIEQAHEALTAAAAPQKEAGAA